MSDFDLKKPWRLDDLPSDLRAEIEEEYSLEPSITYVDEETYGVIEVPSCPFCGKGSWMEHGCRHVVFCYETTNGEYLDMKQSFKEYVMGEWAKSQKPGKNNDLDRVLQDIASNKFPFNNDLNDVMDGFSYQEVCFAHCYGCGYGYAEDKLLSQFKKGKSPPKKKE